MAGRGTRFKDTGYLTPKPLINVNGKTMIEAAVASLSIEGNYIFVTRKYDDLNINKQITEALVATKKNFTQIQIDIDTDGPAATSLLAKEFINNSDELIIANCDQIMRWDSSCFLAAAQSNIYDGILVTYYDNTGKNSYCRLDSSGNVVEVREKVQISTVASNGIHYWARGTDFIRSAEEMIKRNDRAWNGEFYVAPTYNYLIKQQLRIGVFHISKEQHCAIGVPEDLNIFLEQNENI
jgi:dTDP-glucose pyrophosphorylase